MTQTAVILAAGCGSRLRPHLDSHLPKGALELNGTPIVERSIQSLLNAGFQSIIIGTGHGREWYEELAERYPEISCIYNPEFSESGSMHTLSLLAPVISESFLLLESDLIYQSRFINLFQDYSEPNIILATPYNKVGDEVFIEHKDDALVSMSKDRPESLQNATVLAGISRCSFEQFEAMLAYHQAQETLYVDYEDALVACRDNHPSTIISVSDLAIMEIDDAAHMEKAQWLIQTIEQREQAAQHERKCLLNPGPANTTQSVKLAQVVPDICPRELGFAAVMQDCMSMISGLASEEPQLLSTVLIPGSGTAAVESMLSSVIGDNERCLVIDQGAYGKRMADILAIHGIAHDIYSPDPLKALSMESLEKEIQEKKPSHLAIVHHETSTGLLNNLTEIGDCASRYNLVLCVDAMSSFAAVPIDCINENIHFLAASSNKNIQGMAGIGIVIAQNDCLDALKGRKKRSLYLDLYAQDQAFKKNKQSQFTPPVQTIYALQKALQELLKEGIEQRYERYQSAWEQLYNCMADCGFEHLIALEDHGKMITSYIAPKDRLHFSFNHFHDHLYRRHITIYPGKIAQYDTFRIANIGDLSPDDLNKITTVIKQYFS